jgi:uroporphyrinogen-III decarboxylase
MAYKGVLDDFKASVEFRRPSRMPVFTTASLDFDLGWNGLSNEQTRTDVEKMVGYLVESIARFDYDWAWVHPDDYIEFEPLGLKMIADPNRYAMTAEYLPMTRQTLGRFKLPDPAKAMRMPIQLEVLRRVRAALGDTVCVVGRIAAPFSALGVIYGMEALSIAMMEDPGLVQDNLGFFTGHQIAFGKAQLDAGADTVWLGDCNAGSGFVSPRHFEEFAMGPAAEVSAALVKAGGMVIYHTSEKSLPHLKLQMQLPCSAVNVGEGVNIAQVKRDFGIRRCLTGNFDPKLLRDGAPEQVADATERMVRENLPLGGYIFATAEGVMSTTPEKNLRAMMSAARKVR